ncbi:MAG: GlmU family protein [Melioribacteraceae bacterium]|nr:GlmU family protein [Melioribacteraceae bacterium]
MVDTICIIEGIYYSRLLPLVYFRPIYNLRCGILSLKEKIQLSYPGIPIALHTRSYLSDSLREKNPGLKVNELDTNIKSCLFINGRVLADEEFSKKITPDGEDTLFVDGDTIIAARVSGYNLENLKRSMNDVFTISDFIGLFKQQVDVKYINYPWDLIANNYEQIQKDFSRLVNRNEKLINGIVYDGAHLINPDEIFIGENAKIKPGAVLDAEKGSIYIAEGTVVYPNAVIEGPCYIGKNSQVKIGAKIYNGTSIGEVCKVGGEVENSIIHSYSNKQHDGFLGHSYLGSWVNLGADTNNSNLKNNYGSIKVIVNDEQIDSGSMFVGLTMGDHSKSSINTMFNTGTVVGISSNIFGSGFPQKYVPSFSWGGSENMTTYDLEKSIEVAKRVMTRRKVHFSSADERIFRKVFDLTKEERKKRGMPN